MSPPPPSDNITTLSAHLDHLASLEQEAKDLMPFKVDECSFSQGYVRQKVWSCRTCATKYGRGNGVGVCYACSVSCHAEHDLVELFYDPLTEAESMVECIACEDWFHESCLNLQDPQNPIPNPDAVSTVSSNDANESSLLPSSAYAHLICSACILSRPLLRRYAGTAGWMMLVPSDRANDTTAEWAQRWNVIGRKEVVITESNDVAGSIGEKRKDPPVSLESHDAKRLKHDSSDIPTTTVASTKCAAPPQNPIAQHVITALLDTSADDSITPLDPKADVFLLEGAREAICNCPPCAPEVEQLPFPLEEEEEYEPPIEDSPGVSPPLPSAM
ncbi:hypothetical protein QFC19_006226 [Naganishia cerealis]|uniref:Uncharacterized protein n=1 Tax=Naganishia cerealis TaxID=610337 RepID=A0ACC2VHX2_9TREE|nr:hypothetical protein QFC19_006226 [Naganishia cerealis]